MTEIMIPVSPGELIDKLTILRLKAENISEASQLVNVQREFQSLQIIADDKLPSNPLLHGYWGQLHQVNKDLWHIEEDLRKFERIGDFGPAFIALARAVYVTNDKRSILKRKINMLLGSALMEEKSYRAQSESTE